MDLILLENNCKAALWECGMSGLVGTYSLKYLFLCTKIIEINFFELTYFDGGTIVNFFQVTCTQEWEFKTHLHPGVE